MWVWVLWGPRGLSGKVSLIPRSSRIFLGCVFISFLNCLKVRDFLVTNGTSQLILAAELRRRHSAQLQAEPLAVWEQSVAPSQPSLSPASGDTPTPFPTSPGFLCLLVTMGTVSGYQDKSTLGLSPSLPTGFLSMRT